VKLSAVSLLFVAVLVAACATGPPARPDTVEPKRPTTLLLTNDQASTIRVYYEGQLLGVADPMRTTCISLAGVPFGYRSIYIREMGGTTWEIPAAWLRSREGWRLRISHTPNWDRLSLDPARRCKRR